ncbi:DUF4157 domain-containing protein [Stigmatella sp. ncwal1]|uniref:DUF4157 domain-containing protein n=1 Tax=Stigmatella ashevillensis TaxID=2995309 RepID=A0ABT5D228_9BACT|nr:DUF4157 domain-containing protein [Stigmatella ashevillena]MDC0707150.1 DUF4157 domain-containing protein [Stigmatella ashevillena]
MSEHRTRLPVAMGGSIKPRSSKREGAPPHLHPARLLQKLHQAPGALTPRDVLELQRTLGNQAVSQLLANRSGGETRGEGAPTQLKVSVGRSSALPPPAVRQLAAQGTAGVGSAFPHREAIQRAFGRHDISGIQAHTGTTAAATARGMGAMAFATGNHVAFAEAPGLYTAAHEAAHVIQQRAGLQLAGGVGQRGDSHEQHADAVASLVVRGQSAEHLLDKVAPSPSPAPPGRDAVQYTFTVSAHVIAAQEAQYPMSALEVRRIEMPEGDRPDTQYGSRQMSHAVAWTSMFEFWTRTFTGTYPEVRQSLTELSNHDNANDQNPESHELRAQVRHLLGYVDEHTLLPLSEWTQRLEQAVRFYVEAYQKSSFATHAKKAKGRGEASAKQNLVTWNMAMEEEEPPAVTSWEDEVLEHARKLLDVSFSLPADQLCAAYAEWIRMVVTNYAHLGETFAQKVRADVANTPLSPRYQLQFPSLKTLGELLLAWQSNSGTQSLEFIGPTPLPSTAPGFVVSAQVVAHKEDRYPLDAITVQGVLLSEGDRPNTQYGVRQLSHTVAWTAKIQEWAARFRGPLRQVLGALLKASQEDHGVDTNEESRRLRESIALPLRQYLEATPAPEAPLSAWTALVNSSIKGYVEAYQQASFSTHADIPKGRGEAASKASLSMLEQRLASGGGAGSKPKDVFDQALKLVDAPLDKSANLIGKAYNDWLHMLEVVYPHVMQAHAQDFNRLLAATVLPSTLQAPGVQTLAELLDGWRRNQTPASFPFPQQSPSLWDSAQPTPDVSLEPSPQQQAYLAQHHLQLVEIKNDGDCFYNATRAAGVQGTVSDLRERVALALEQEDSAEAEAIREGSWAGPGADRAPEILAQQLHLQYRVIHPNAYIEFIGQGGTVITLVLVQGPPQHYHLAR